MKQHSWTLYVNRSVNILILRRFAEMKTQKKKRQINTGILLFSYKRLIH